MPGGPGELPTDISPIQISVTTGPILVVLTVIAGHPSATTIDNFEENRFIIYKTWKFHSTPGAVPKVMGRECARAGDSAFIEVQSRILGVHSLFVNLKRELEFKALEEKKNKWL